jgi:hypothetical protein
VEGVARKGMVVRNVVIIAEDGDMIGRGEGL